MAERHPYISSQNALIQVLNHLRKSFPATLNSDILKRLGYAPGNESYTLNIARYLRLIDENGSRQEEAHKVFTQHDDVEFRKEFSGLIRSAYSDLFELYQESAWGLTDSALVTFFRQSDQSTELVGGRQALTFKTLAQYAGQGAAQEDQKAAQKTAVKRVPARTRVSKKQEAQGREEVTTSRTEASSNSKMRGDVGLTVRIEVNLPSGGDQETYDRIFRSIRENLLNE